LIFILIFGLFLGNIGEISKNKWLSKLNTEKFSNEVYKFKNIAVEATFLIRSFFFILFGYLMDISEIINIETLPWSFSIIIGIFIIRFISIKLLNLHTSPLLFVAPRGLITILLFLAILPEDSILIVNKSLIIQTIVLSILAMMMGLMFSKEKETQIENKVI
jgi:hypothetical protein